MEKKKIRLPDILVDFIQVEDNALYVKYTAVPEPAAIAALFGVLALGFALRRKRM